MDKRIVLRGLEKQFSIAWGTALMKNFPDFPQEMQELFCFLM